MNKNIMAGVAELLVDTIIARAVDNVKDEARKEGIVIPRLYLEAVEVGVSAGMVETLKVLEEIQEMQGLDKLR